jgi:two-component system cell cycle sensor histidine kinase/response regulator CckA
VTHALRTLLRVALVATGYFASARLGYALAIGNGTVTLWPPSGVMLGLLAMAPLRKWPAIIAGGLLGSFASDLQSNYPAWLACAAAFANILESVVGAFVIQRLLPAPVSFSTLRAVGVLTVMVAGASNAVTAFAGTAILNAGFDTSLVRSWVGWWRGDGLGILTVAPVVMTWTEAWRRREPVFRQQPLEAVLLLIVLVGSGYFVLGPGTELAARPGPYAIFPVLLWAALRFGPLGSSTATLIAAGLAIWFASLDMGPFIREEATDAAPLVEAYTFLVVVSVSSHLAAAALSERQQAIGELHASRERYRNVVETATDAIITIDAENRIRFANSATERMFGYAPHELQGQNVKVLIPSPLVGRHKNGTEIPLEVSFGAASESGTHEVTGILRDISEKRAAARALQTLEEQYRHSQKMEAIGQLAGGIAHDFNNLLTIVQVNCELLREELPPDSQARAEIEQIYTASNRAASLTRQLLAFSRRQVLEPRVVSLSETLSGIEPMLRRLIGEHVVVRIKAPETVGPVTADPGQLEQVILNLAINARDAMPDGGTLTIELDEVLLEGASAYEVDVHPGPYARLSVIDTGTGMDADTVARVFEPFFTTKPLGRGTGLGLSTVHGIIKQSGGGITVESEPGKGSVFRVFLPRVDAPVDPGARPHETGGKKQRIETVLVVEDEEEVGRLARRILENHGYRVLLAKSPDEALMIASGEPDIAVLLSDVVLPGMSGPALAAELVRTHPAVRVLYMSGYSDDALSQRGVRDPGTELIEKPFSANALVAKVDEVAHRVRADRLDW